MDLQAPLGDHHDGFDLGYSLSDLADLHDLPIL